MIKVNAQWHKTDENGNTILNEDKTAILTDGIKINCQERDYENIRDE